MNIFLAITCVCFSIGAAKNIDTKWRISELEEDDRKTNHQQQVLELQQFIGGTITNILFKFNSN